MVPGRHTLRNELQSDPLDCLGADRLEELRPGCAAAVTREQLNPELRDEVAVAVDHGPRLDHHSPQLLVLDAVLDLQRGSVVALEVADLVGLCVRSRTDLAVAELVL